MYPTPIKRRKAPQPKAKRSELATKGEAKRSLRQGLIYQRDHLGTIWLQDAFHAYLGLWDVGVRACVIWDLWDALGTPQFN